ncbi:MAG TPA: efflux RND transporter periplasmic adaptor subunit [Povalibacter sp.]|nr:efflux RND transporter periplasmic adaptor subunit [Povalibacter sp.]
MPVSLLLAACGEGEQPAAQLPPLPVVTVTVESSSVPNTFELPGRIEAVRSADVRARVDGIVERRLFEEGTDVAANAPLFLIDPRDLRTQLQQAQAALARAQSARADAASVVERFKPLVSRQALSALEYDRALTTLRQAEAGVSDAQAAVERSQLQLDRTTVRASIAGRVGRAMVSEGALVSAAGATLMTRINQLSPVYATFTKSSAQIMDLMQKVRAGEISLGALQQIEVRLIKDNGQPFDQVGHLEFADFAVDPSTGSQVVRARFQNPDHVLLPGQFVRGMFTAGTITEGISIPERAVAISGDEARVMTVSAEGIAASRTVTLGRQIEGQWIIRSGLKPGEQVIVDGWQRVQPGARVSPQGASAPQPAT